MMDDIRPVKGGWLQSLGERCCSACNEETKLYGTEHWGMEQLGVGVEISWKWTSGTYFESFHE